jgi:ComF family protein
MRCDVRALGAHAKWTLPPARDYYRVMGPVALAFAAGRFVLDAVLPPACLTCDAPVEAPGRLCTACFRATAFVTDPCCRRCGAPFSHAGLGGRTMECLACLGDPPPWRLARAALRYDSQARRIVLPLKHGDRVETAAALALHMARAGAALLREADVLVPVPLHRHRLLSRRYNQSALLAQAVARRVDCAVMPDALRRVRRTPSLAGKTRMERAAIVAGAFAMHPGRSVAGKGVVLVDDVLTTGATARGCTQILLAAGASHVDVLVAARVDYADADGLSG